MNSKTQMKTLLVFFIYAMCLTSLNAQNKVSQAAPANSGRLIHEIEGGYFVGGSGSVYFFTYNSGLSLSYSTGWKLNDDVSLSGTIGIEQNIEGTLFPLLAKFKKDLGKRKNQFLSLHGGYALGSGEDENSSFKYGGGLAGGIAYGVYLFKFKKIKMFSELGYKLRQVNLKFEPFDGGGTTTNKLDNHFLRLQIGFQI